MVIQRVSEAKVEVEDQTVGAIGNGLLVFVGVSPRSKMEDVDKFCKKLCETRLFTDSEGKMNLSLNDQKGEILLVSQFTLYGSLKKGRRPSFSAAAPADKAKSLYLSCVEKLEELLPGRVQTGVFGAKMKVHLINDGPVTFILEDL